MKQVTVALHPGSCAEEVINLLRALSAKVVVIDSLALARGAIFSRLLLLGGPDINPFWYGQSATHTRRIDKERDLIEWTLVRRALADEIPVMGICRGHQMLAAAAGGSLYQDIYADGATPYHAPTHRLTDVLLPLAGHIPVCQVNSYHHQAVRTPPYGWEVVAWSSDGLVEAIHRPGALGVQWHPEMMVRSDPRWRKLFKWFLAGLE
jgi:putative glutamine amidotransferase